MGLKELGHDERARGAGEAGDAETGFSLGERFRQRFECRPLSQHRTEHSYGITSACVGQAGGAAGGGAEGVPATTRHACAAPGAAGLHPGAPRPPPLGGNGSRDPPAPRRSTRLPVPRALARSPSVSDATSRHSKQFGAYLEADRAAGARLDAARRARRRGWSPGSWLLGAEGGPAGGGGGSGRGRRDPFPPSGGGRGAPGWSPAAPGQRTRAAWSSATPPAPRPRPPARHTRVELARGLGEIEGESLELDREVDVLEADVACGTLMRAGAKFRIALIPAATSWSATTCAASPAPRRSRSGSRAPSPRGRGRGSRRSGRVDLARDLRADPRRRSPRSGTPGGRSPDSGTSADPRLPKPTSATGHSRSRPRMRCSSALRPET